MSSLYPALQKKMKLSHDHQEIAYIATEINQNSISIYAHFNTIYNVYVSAFSVQQVVFQEMAGIVSPPRYWWDKASYFVHSPGTQVQLHYQMHLMLLKKVLICV